MSVETDALTEAAQRFAEVIRTERATTIETLERERQAAVQIIEALRRENARRAKGAGGRFLIGFVVGAAIGAAAVAMLAPRSGIDLRQSLTTGVNTGGRSLSDRLKSALAVGQQAAASREQELWSQYRQRIANNERADDENPFR
ncbi:MAG: hypothetical protein HC822_01215 [Oscillochloris sp.]|nr:hypothetical protein [Oscillochloris sp.]